MGRFAACLAVAVLAGSCETTRETSAAGTHLAVVQAAEPARAWRVLAGDRELGSVVMYAAGETEGPTGRFYSVRNPWQQELGTVDALGRAFRFVPHEREARWVATGTLAECAAAILAAPTITPGSAIPTSASSDAPDPRRGTPATPRTLPPARPQPVELVEVPLEALDGGT